jgi:hypothetical protein
MIDEVINMTRFFASLRMTNSTIMGVSQQLARVMFQEYFDKGISP